MKDIEIIKKDELKNINGGCFAHDLGWGIRRALMSWNLSYSVYMDATYKSVQH